MSIITILMLTGQVKAGTDNLYPEVKKFLEMIKTEQVTNEYASEMFRKIMKDVDKEVKDDLEKHNYKEADLLLRYYIKIAELLEDNVLVGELSRLLNDVQNEMNLFHNKEGVFENDGKLFIGGKTKTNSTTIQSVKDQIESAAFKEFMNYISKKFGVDKVHINGIRVLGYTNLGGGEYQYLVEIMSVRTINNSNFTKTIVENIPHFNF